MTKVELFRIEAARNPVALLSYEPRRPRRISIVAGHGYSSSKQNLDFLCAFLASHGFGVYSLDFPGHKLGSSGGVLRGVDDCIEAMMRVVAFSRERRDDPVYTMGHSMGGMTAIFTAALDRQHLGHDRDRHRVRAADVARVAAQRRQYGFPRIVRRRRAVAAARRRRRSALRRAAR